MVPQQVASASPGHLLKCKFSSLSQTYWSRNSGAEVQQSVFLRPPGDTNVHYSLRTTDLMRLFKLLHSLSYKAKLCGTFNTDPHIFPETWLVIDQIKSLHFSLYHWVRASHFETPLDTKFLEWEFKSRYVLIQDCIPYIHFLSQHSWQLSTKKRTEEKSLA